MIDWSDGDYEKTALTLEPVTARVMEVALPRPGERVLDIGCGTGNAALAAARLGAEVTAVDPAARLLQVARERAEREGLTLAWAQGEAGAIPAEDARFDLAVSVFAAIFAPDAERVASELLRVVRPGGRVVMTSWISEGGIAEAGRLLWSAMAPLAPPSPTPPPSPPRWGEQDFVEQLFGARGARVTVSEESIAFTAASPAAWFAEQERHHPAWRSIHRALAARPGAWDELRDRSVERLAAWNEDPTAFLTRSRYLLITVHR
jgi:SAM-dependent methyltransferase